MQLLFVTLLFLAAHIRADTRMISPSGTDTSDCTTIPCQSLNYTISQSKSGDILDLDGGIYSGAQNRDIYLQNINLTIRGSELVRVIVDLQDEGRAFLIYNSSITIKSITFTNGNALSPTFSGSKGGAIASVMSNLNLEYVTFDKCHSNGQYQNGAAGALLTDGQVSLKQVDFVDCFGDSAGAYFAQGVNGSITNTNFNNCSTGDSGWGGACKSAIVWTKFLTSLSVVIEDGSNLTFDNCTFIGCRSGFGGAIDDGGNAVYEITRSTFKNNQALYGSAVYHFGQARGTFYSCDFISNTASQTGGAVYTSTNVSPTYTSCNFYNNSAPTGGAITARSTNPITILDCKFQHNHANDTGSAIAVYGPIILRDNVFEANNCDSNGTLSLFLPPTASSMINGNIFTQNTAVQGAAIYFELNTNSDIWTFVNTTCENNVAAISGGAVYLTGLSLVNFQTALFKGNLAGIGGAVTLDMTAQVTFNMSTFDSNVASNEGGGIYIDGRGLLSVLESNMSSNHASNGGALALSETATRCPILHHVTIQSNSASKCCGAIFFGDQAIQCSFNSICEECTLTANTVETCGSNCTCDSGGATNYQCSPSTSAPAGEPYSELQAPMGGGPQAVPVSTLVPAIIIPTVAVGVGVFFAVFFVKKRKAAQFVTTSINMQNLSAITDEERLQVPYKQLKFNKEIGSGSFGKVFIGEWQKTEVALKLNTSGTSQEFIQEARLMIALRPHPNIVQFLGLSTDGPYPVMILEFCDEGSLDNLLFDSNKDITVEKQLAIISAIAKGMYHLHSNNIVHRDLAARNILLSNGTVKISDFGMSRTLLNMDQGFTKSNIGPIRWMAPESLKIRAYSKSSDVWSFGILVFEITARVEPHMDQDLFTSALMIRDEGLTPTLPPNIDPFLVDLMHRCWNINPEARPTFEEICDLLQIRIDQ